MGRGDPHSIMVKALDFRTVMGKFELQSHILFTFRQIPFEKV